MIKTMMLLDLDSIMLIPVYPALKYQWAVNLKSILWEKAFIQDLETIMYQNKLFIKIPLLLQLAQDMDRQKLKIRSQDQVHIILKLVSNKMDQR
jgi:hypothetical protein